ncbi:transglycosylase domain-containing protein [Azospirillum thermophilum]|uniref:peptidoglycan glycosyltransferase n=1 Tax=Azospirillum thermophilum TaxID=2202148 RepID=A0A2S2CSY7_9PROT|nr:transglycosylase domain-containing protein [Azospirillum thermophilum]AWK87624.1 penicillin-binding protein [Azospirillum thermophilum]
MPRPTRLHRSALAAACALPLLAGTPALAMELFGEQFRTVDDVLAYNRGTGLRFLDRQGRFLGSAGEAHGDTVRLEALPRHLIQALIAKEDRRFLEHDGVDYHGVARALAVAVTSGRFSQGGSTLTQQTMKIIFLGDYGRWTRKAYELYSAGDFEEKVGKRNILYLYLNRAYFGSGAYGVDAAARVYFGKPAARLTLKESAMLVGLLPAPSRLNPFADPVRAERKAELVLDAMAEAGFVTRREAEQAKRQNPMLATVNRTAALTTGHVRGTLKARFDRFAAGHYAGDGQPQGTYTVRTTLDRDLQAAAVRTVERVMTRRGKALEGVEVALVALDGAGEVRAMVGGRDSAARSDHFNRAVQARRQPGSAFKLFVYLAALERGLTPASSIDASRVTYADGRSVRNFDGRYPDRLTLAEAFAHSSNTAAVRLAQGHGEEVAEVARRLGISTPPASGPGLALGAGETTLIELTQAYAAVASGGLRVEAHAFQRITDPRGREVYSYGTREQPRVLAPQTVTAMKGLLADVLSDGTGRNARITGARLNGAAGGKTGTTNDFRDALFVGYAGGLTVGVWVGKDDNTPMKGVTGGSVPAEIWRGVMTEAVRRR